jgi:hypothetical protein
MSVEADIEKCYLGYGYPSYLEDGNIDCKKRSTPQLIEACKLKNGTVKLDDKGEFISCTLLNSNLSIEQIDRINIINKNNDFLEKAYGYRDQPKIEIGGESTPIIFRPKPIPFSTIVITPTVAETNNTSIEKEEKNNTQTVITVVKEVINTGKTPTIDIAKEKVKSKDLVYSDSTYSEIEKVIIDHIEGGYYNVAHSLAFSDKSKGDYKSSGETLWGIDRFAGAGEFDNNKEVRAAWTYYWSIVDLYSGYGKHASYSKLHSLTTKYTLDKNGNLELHDSGKRNKKGKVIYTTQIPEAWDFKNHPLIPTAWKHNYLPTAKDPYYGALQQTYSKTVVRVRDSLINRYFKDSSELIKIINADGRLLFAQGRASFNGAGNFQEFANELIKNYNAAKVKGTIPEDAVAKGTYILNLDLNGRNRLNQTDLIQKDIKLIKQLSATT